MSEKPVVMISSTARHLPEMPAFDESKFEPMPEVEIDLDDEFYVGNEEGE